MASAAHRTVIFTLAAANAVAALFAHFGRVGTLPDVLTHGAPVYLALSTTLGLIEFATRRYVPIIVASTIGILASAALLAPELMRPDPIAPNLPGPSHPLTLVQFNALRTNESHDAIADWLAAQRPDVVMIEEITPGLRDRILQKTGWFVVGRLTTVMIFSPHPITGIGVRPEAPWRGAPTWVNAKMTGPWGEVPLLALHAPWPIDDLDDRGGPIIAGVVEDLGRDRLILAGDFNSTPWSFGRQRNDRSFGIERLTRARTSWPVWAGPLAAFPIDHVYAGRAWRAIRLWRGPPLGSDHYPLVVTLLPNSTGAAATIR